MCIFLRFSLRQQSSEMQKRKSIESAQSAADLRLHLEKYLSHLKEVQNTVAEKTSAVQQEAFKTKRLQVHFFFSPPPSKKNPIYIFLLLYVYLGFT